MKEKIRVEFELTPEQAKELLQEGSKTKGVITEEELIRLGSLGTIRAASYLDEDDIVFLKIPQKVKRVASRASRRVVPALIVADIVHTVVTSAEENLEGDIPKE
jgi:hypothetical protein